MSQAIEDNKFVELSYKVIDVKTGQVLTSVEFPIGYVHGVSTDLAPTVVEELEGKGVGDVIEVPINGNQIYGPRDESLVITDRLENVPEEYRELGTTIHMENENGDMRSFIVTRIDDETLTIDGNNPLCGRDVSFVLEVLTVRDATAEEIEEGGAIVDTPDINPAFTMPI